MFPNLWKPEFHSDFKSPSLDFNLRQFNLIHSNPIHYFNQYPSMNCYIADDGDRHYIWRKTVNTLNVVSENQYCLVLYILELIVMLTTTFH